MNRKYEFVEGDTITIEGRTLHRIRAIEDIGQVARKGDLGGYIESEENLSENAWVSGDAKVFEDAKVFGNAWVYGGALVLGNAKVYEDALVSEGAKVSDDAIVSGDAQVYGNSRVYENAHVCGNACVYGNALVSGYAFVGGNAYVYEDALVSGNAQVCGSANVCGDARVDKNNVFFASNVGSEGGNLTVFTGASGNLRVTRGCFYGTDEEFLEQVRRKHAGTRYQTEYELLIQVARSRILGD